MNNVGRQRTRQKKIDIRVVVGCVLISVAVTGTIWVVLQAQPDQIVLTARHTMLPGHTLTADDVVEDRVALSGHATAYLDPGTFDSIVAGEGLTVTEPIGEGELVPQRAVSVDDEPGYTRIVVTGGSTLPEGVERGGAVDVWARDDESVPELIVERARVVSVSEATGVVSRANEKEVEVSVRDSDVPRLILANSGTLHIVLAHLSEPLNRGSARPDEGNTGSIPTQPSTRESSGGQSG